MYLSKNKKNIKNCLMKFFQFNNLKKNIFITWACFRNVYSQHHTMFTLKKSYKRPLFKLIFCF